MRGLPLLLAVLPACGRVGYGVPLDAPADAEPWRPDASEKADGPAATPDAPLAGRDAVPTFACGGVWETDFAAGAPPWATVWNIQSGPAATVTVQAGVLMVAPAPSTSPNWAGIHGPEFAFANRRLSIEVSQMVNVASSATVFLQISQYENPQVDLRQTQGMLQVRNRNDPMLVDINLAPYDPAAHRFWGIRETAGTLFFETSPDGLVFTTLHTMPTPAWASSRAVLSIGAGIPSAEAAPGEAHFDNVGDCTPGP